MFFKLNFILFSLVFKRQHECLNASSTRLYDDSDDNDKLSQDIFFAPPKLLRTKQIF